MDAVDCNLRDINRIFDTGPNSADKEAGLKWLARYGLVANRMRCPNSFLPLQPHVAHAMEDQIWMSLVTDVTPRTNAAARARGAAGNADTRWRPIDGFRWRCKTCYNPPTDANGVGPRPIHVYAAVRKNSFWEASHLQFRDAMALAHIWAHNPRHNIADYIRESGVQSPTTVVDWLNFFREVCAQWATDNMANRVIGGPGRTVEIDESKLFTAKYHRGNALLRERNRDWVFGMIERGTNNIVVVSVQHRDAATLLPIIQQWIAPGSRIISDGWAAYGGIQYLQQQYDHRWVNHRVNFVDPIHRDVHTNTIEGAWNLLKRDMRHLRGTSPALFESYLFQFMFRRNFGRGRRPGDRQGDQLIFRAFLKEIRRQFPVD